MSYPEKFREAVLAFHEEGHTVKETSALFKVSVYATRSWKKLLKEKGSLEIQKRNRPFKKIDPVRLREYIPKNSDAYPHIKVRWQKNLGAVQEPSAKP